MLYKPNLPFDVFFYFNLNHRGYEVAGLVKTFDLKDYYRRLSLIDLVRKIVEQSDVLALEEFHNNRTLFRLKRGEKRDLHFVEFLNALCQRVEKDNSFKRHDYQFNEQVYELTMDKFCNLPNLSSSLSKYRKDKNQSKSRKGPDCRNNFKAFLDRISKDFRIRPPVGQIEAETRAAATLQGLVSRHFHYSLLAAGRNVNRLWSKYNWKINGEIIVLFFPKNISGRNRGQWLAKNVKERDLSKPDKKQRIQKIIDQKLVFEIVDCQIEDLADPDFEQNRIWPKTQEQFGISLGKVVADEKAANIHKQRRSIRNLGEERLKQLILRIFEDIKYDDYQDKEIAAEYYISRATLSRFAGSNWAKTKSAVPDLWHNTANVLSQHEAFRDAALEAGYLKTVEGVLEKTETDENE